MDKISIIGLFLITLTSSCYRFSSVSKIELTNSIPIEDMKTTGLSSEIDQMATFVKTEKIPKWIEEKASPIDSVYSVMGYKNNNFHVTFHKKTLSVNIFINNDAKGQYLLLQTQNGDNFQPMGIIEREGIFTILIYFNGMYNLFKVGHDFSECQWYHYEFL